MQTIRYVGELLEHTGYGSAARINIALLTKMGINVEGVTTGAKSSQDPDWKTAITANCIKEKLSHPHAVIAHIYPPQALDRYKIPGVPLISYLAWEVDMLPSVWVQSLNRYADIIVTTCEEMRRVFIKSGVHKPVYVLGPTIFDEDLASINTAPMTQSELPSGLSSIYTPNKFIFYSIFQWIERKDPEKLIAAFVQEFDNTEDDVMLLIKSNMLGYTQEQTNYMIGTIKRITQELNIMYTPEVRLIPHRVSEEHMRMIHRIGGCFVSPCRGEGTALSVVDAILHERPVIITPYGGPQDYTDPKYTHWLKYSMIPIRNPIYCYNYFNAYMRWADVDILDLRKAMRLTYESSRNNKQIDTKCITARKHLCNTYSLPANTAKMEKILQCML